MWVPDLRFLRTYRREAGRADLQAGLTVAVFAIPQVMAYAILAGVAPIYGLYTALIAGLIGGLWGHSPFVSTGPSNSAALLTAAALAGVAAGVETMQAIFHFAVLVGVFRLALAGLRSSRLIRYVSDAVMLGFTAGVGTLIALGQMHHLLGVEIDRHRWFPAKVADIVSQIGYAHGLTCAIGVLMAILMLSLHRFNRRVPVAFLAIVACTVVAELADGGAVVRRVQDIAEVPDGLPVPRGWAWDWGLARTMIPFAFAVSVIGLIEVATIARFFAEKHGVEVDDDREFFGQGLAQLVSSFFQGIPTSGSFSRSALMEFSGVRTRAAQLVYTVVIGLALLLVAHWLNPIPVTALAGLLLVMGFRLIKWRVLAATWRAGGDAARIVAITFLTTIFVHVEYGVFVGIAADRLLHWYRSRR